MNFIFLTFVIVDKIRSLLEVFPEFSYNEV